MRNDHWLVVACVVVVLVGVRSLNHQTFNHLGS